MSFLNSVISSIGDNGVAPSASRPTVLSKKSSSSLPFSKSLASPGTVKPVSGAETLKRKVDQRDGGSMSNTPSSSAARPVSSGLSRSTTGPPAQRVNAAQTVRAAEPAKGGVRVSTSAVTPKRPGNTIPAQKAAPTTPAAPTGPPKKGYLAVLERAKAAQEAAKPFGQIKHQKTAEKDRLSRKARLQQATEAKTAVKQAVHVKGIPKTAVASRNGAASATDAAPSETKKRKVEVAYKGTMRPVPSKPAYNGTMRTGGSSTQTGRSSGHAGRPTKQPSYRYADEDEDEDDEEDEDDLDDYDSASSDMEACMDDIYKEEVLSGMVAKKEDEEALKEEMALKQQKLERQRKLQALNAAAAKRKKIY